ncbi:hypothetical protein N0V88_007217 [Collariella sp. IMI 366227]|nr:hypothetical protein N0V88_007217 [Collariella sp. IMI 366227]
MAIRGADYNDVPPPLPPPRMVPINGPTDPNLQFKESMRRDDYGSPESDSLGHSFKRRDMSFRSDFSDDGYHSFDSMRIHGSTIPEDGAASVYGGYEPRDDDTDFPMEETTRMRSLAIEDQWRERDWERERDRDCYQPGQKRRASSPPSDDAPLANDMLRRRDGGLISRGSPIPRLLVIPQHSVSSSMSSRTPSEQPLPPQITRTVVSPRKLAEIPKSHSSLAAKLKGPYMCECCPKKPKKFESEEDLRAHESEKQYECSFCGNRFKNKNEAERHQNSLHVRRHSWSCSALTGYERAFHDSTVRPGEADVCGYCGEEFGRNGQSAGASCVSDQDWEERIRHLQDTHKFRECNSSKKFYRADHFRQHLKHSHAGTSGKWTNMLENACMLEEEPPVPSR